MADVLVIGAGPAGLAAATAARARGANVTLLDASDELGGQYWRHLPAARPAARERLLHHGWEHFTRMRDALVADAGCTLITEAQVWAIEPAGDGPQPSAPTVHALIGPADAPEREPMVFRPDALVLATGAHDRTLPFPGWDLPGVFTAGAAQALAKGERVAVGERVVVAGAGPFLLPVAQSLSATGARVVGVYEANRMSRLAAGWLPKPWRLLGAARKGGELAGYAAHHLRRGIPYRLGKAVIAAHGRDRVEAVTVATLDRDWRPVAGTERRIAVDAVCISHGFTPRLELPIAAGCAITSDRFVVIGADQQTSIANVYAAGEITGIGGVDAASAEGTIAGHVAAGGATNDAAIARAVRDRATFTDFATRIEAAHGIRPGWTAWLEDDTLVCRCEEVPYGRLRQTAEQTCATGLRSLKLTTRASLGICQGRICGRTVEQLLGGSFSDASTGASTDRRPIAAPVRLAELAASAAPAAPAPTEGNEN
ncbi:FAD/NAD(P)-binding oxidoreductase [Agromyces aerolatus]|uniref:FAD/NAD(P)-binding oxidoreductase n=1 Tax=Agromyces sp. LY-1074 TaxID=3074080 RepID=UPI002867261C|nr:MULTISPECIES: FAD/NAD(P)-binding oxidoreductase [unclassified Agromyces]MDR5701566.1 FAD/NAD(P)-binding oxidoreductase [Agromyces sp. LY-1074]MDR5707827.1 FAD/NAD(P)-binding oxidoreductase [Agromyces sp. LY-1358]